jgi:hypothetical protein
MSFLCYRSSIVCLISFLRSLILSILYWYSTLLSAIPYFSFYSSSAIGFFVFVPFFFQLIKFRLDSTNLCLKNLKILTFQFSYFLYDLWSLFHSLILSFKSISHFLSFFFNDFLLSCISFVSSGRFFNLLFKRVKLVDIAFDFRFFFFLKNSHIISWIIGWLFGLLRHSSLCNSLRNILRNCLRLDSRRASRGFNWMLWLRSGDFSCSSCHLTFAHRDRRWVTESMLHSSWLHDWICNHSSVSSLIISCKLLYHFRLLDIFQLL